jgi:hypothetical protein
MYAKVGANLKFRQQLSNNIVSQAGLFSKIISYTLLVRVTAKFQR